MAARSKTSLNSTQFLARKTWDKPPAITILAGGADFFKKQLIELTKARDSIGKPSTEISGDFPRFVDEIWLF